MLEQKNALKICFVGSARYRRPLETTDEKKFQVLKTLGELFVIGFSQDRIPRRFTQHAHFYLFPEFSWAVLRYIEMFLIVPFLVLWLIFRYRVQVLVAQSPYEGAMVAFAKRCAKWFGREVVLVLESHGDFEESLFMQRKFFFPSFYRFLMNRISSFTFHHADVLRAVSRSTRQQMECWKPGHHVFQFFTWTDIEVFQHVGDKRNYSVSQTFMYAGVLIPRKGLTHLVRAFGRVVPDFSQARLLIIGKAENQADADEVKALVKQLKQEKRIQFIGEVSQQELADYMVQADAFVFPTYSEGLPRVVFEAMSTGLPVIATAVSGIPEVVQEGVTGFLLQPGDETGLTEKMRWMLGHPEEAHEMGQKAYNLARKSFSTSAYVQGYRQVFDAAQVLLNQR